MKQKILTSLRNMLSVAGLIYLQRAKQSLFVPIVISEYTHTPSAGSVERKIPRFAG